jgi:hypothetical protein
MSQKIKVVCNECGKKFQTASMLPTCPKCKGSDIEPADDALLKVAPFYKSAPKPEMPVIIAGPARYRVTTKIPYFNHTKTFATFDSMQAWVLASTGVNLPAAPEAAALGRHTRGREDGEVIVEAVR